MFDRLSLSKLIVAVATIFVLVGLVIYPSEQVRGLVDAGGWPAGLSMLLLLMLSVEVIVETIMVYTSLRGMHHTFSTLPWMGMAATSCGNCLVLVKGNVNGLLPGLMFLCGVASCAVGFAQAKHQLLQARTERTS